MSLWGKVSLELSLNWTKVLYRWLHLVSLKCQSMSINWFMLTSSFSIDLHPIIHHQHVWFKHLSLRVWVFVKDWKCSDLALEDLNDLHWVLGLSDLQRPDLFINLFSTLRSYRRLLRELWWRLSLWYRVISCINCLWLRILIAYSFLKRLYII